MAKIAVALEQALARRAADGTSGGVSARMVAGGQGWTVEDVVCTSGPRDRAFEERHPHVSIAMVAAGSFQYRADSRAGAHRELMTPGSLLLGNAGQCFECGHEHGSGDRCLSFRYSPDYFESLAADAGTVPVFGMLRLPPLKELSPLIALACSGLAGSVDADWEELSIKLAGRVLGLAGGLPRTVGEIQASAAARVTRIARRIEQHPEGDLGLGTLAREAGLSRYYFLRVFGRLTGLTPHQYVLRTRLREAALRIAAGRGKILDIALDCGFGDVSNFNRAFRNEFGVSPRAWTRTTAKSWETPAFPLRSLPQAIDSGEGQNESCAAFADNRDAICPRRGGVGRGFAPSPDFARLRNPAF